MGTQVDVDAAILTTRKWLDKYGLELTNDEFRSVSDAIDNLNNMKKILLGKTSCCDREKTREETSGTSIFGPSHCSRCGHERRAEDYLGFCSECGEDGPCSANKRAEIPSNTLFVAMLMPFHDGSGEAQLLGVYSTKEKAEANCYRALKTLGYDQPTKIFESVLNEGCNG